MALSRNAKIFWMFAPLVVAGILLAVMVNDERHPRTDTDTCMVIAVGDGAHALRTPQNTIYAHDDNPLHDVAMRCQRRNTVVINDMDVFYSPVHEGNGAVITHRVYRFLPTRWHVDISTPDSDGRGLPDVVKNHG